MNGRKGGKGRRAGAFRKETSIDRSKVRHANNRGIDGGLESRTGDTSITTDTRGNDAVGGGSNSTSDAGNARTGNQNDGGRDSVSPSTSDGSSPDQGRNDSNNGEHHGTTGTDTGSVDGSDGDSGRRAGRSARRTEREQRVGDVIDTLTAQKELDERNEKPSLVITIPDEKPAKGTSRRTRAQQQPSINVPKKEASKSEVATMASTIQDVYELGDNAAEVGFTVMDKIYPTGALKMDDDTAHKLAKNWTKLQKEAPEVVKKIDDIMVPVMLISTLLLDTTMKARILTDAWKSSPSKSSASNRDGHYGEPERTDSTTNETSPAGLFPFNTDGSGNVTH